MRQVTLGILFLFYINGLLLAQESPEQGSFEFIEDLTINSLLEESKELLGKNIEEAFKLYGLPHSLTLLRGSRPELDSIVSLYKDNMGLYWVDDRIWQVRIDIQKRNLSISSEEVETLLGIPEEVERVDFKKESAHTLWIYRLEGNGYPISLALYFDQRKQLLDLYYYRSDY